MRIIVRKRKKNKQVQKQQCGLCEHLYKHAILFEKHTLFC